MKYSPLKSSDVANSLINLGEGGAAYLASKTMSLLVLFLYMIL